jgi:hypothetical protein
MHSMHTYVTVSYIFKSVFFVKWIKVYFEKILCVLQYYYYKLRFASVLWYCLHSRRVGLSSMLRNSISTSCYYFLYIFLY